MSSFHLDPAQVIASSIDHPPAISAQTMVDKLVLHWKLFTGCVLVVPALAMGVAHLVPPVYKGSSEILVRHLGGSNSLYGDFAPTVTPLSGATASELMRSNPIVAQMCESVGVESEDVARPAYKVVFGKVASAIVGLFYNLKEDDGGSGNPGLKYAMLAEDLKSSIDATTLMVDRGTSSNRDEVIQLTIKSTSREKVAGMANGICDEFIKDYNRRSRAEALAARTTLAEQAKLLEATLAQFNASGHSGEAAPDFAGSDGPSSKTLASSLAQAVSELELRLVQLRITFSQDDPKVQQAEAELGRMQSLLNTQEAADGAKEQLAQVKKKLRQMELAEKLYETDQGNITVVERAITPKKSKTAAVLRYAIPGAAGLAAGVLIGIIGAIGLNLLDPRIFVAVDVAPASGLPLLGAIKRQFLPLPALAEIGGLPLDGARPALLQVQNRLDLAIPNGSRALVVTSPKNEAATASVACQLAALQARDRDGRVLLIDANFDTPWLTPDTAAAQSPGLLDLLGGKASDLAQVVRPSKLPRLFYLEVGTLALRDEVGAARERWKDLLDRARAEFGTVIVHAPGLLNSREGLTVANAVDRVVIVTARRLSTKPDLADAAALLTGANVMALGVIHGGRGR